MCNVYTSTLSCIVYTGGCVEYYCVYQAIYTFYPRSVSVNMQLNEGMHSSGNGMSGEELAGLLLVCI